MSNVTPYYKTQIYYDGTYKTALSNYIIQADDPPGQIIISNGKGKPYIGIKPPALNDINTKQYMLVYSKGNVGAEVYNPSNFSWIQTDAGMLNFTENWQILTSSNSGKQFTYLSVPDFDKTYFLSYNPSGGIMWSTTTTEWPFIGNTPSQVLGYNINNSNPESIIGYRKNYVLRTTGISQANQTGLEFGYVTPAIMNLNYNEINGTGIIVATNKNTFEILSNYNTFPFSHDLSDAMIIFLDSGTDPASPFFDGIMPPKNANQLMYTYYAFTNKNGDDVFRWKYGYFNQELAGLGSDTNAINGFVAVWSNGQLIAKDVRDVHSVLDNYYFWSASLSSSLYFMGETEHLTSSNYTHTITIPFTTGNIYRNLYLLYGDNIDLYVDITLHCTDLRDFVIDDEYLYGINISVKFVECNSYSAIIEGGSSGIVSIVNLPILTATPYFNLKKNLIMPFRFKQHPPTANCFLPVEMLISSINDSDLDIKYHSLQSKYKVKIACDNFKQSFKIKRLYVRNTNPLSKSWV